MCIRDRSKRDATSAGIGPASGSLEKQRGLPYAGSRRSKQRFEYRENSRSAFVELHRSWYLPKEEGPQEFKAWLEAVPGVERVEWQTERPHRGLLVITIANKICSFTATLLDQGLRVHPSSLSSRAISI